MFYTLYLILFCSFFLRSEFPILVIHRPGLMFKFQILVFTFHQRYMAKSWNCLIFSINPPKLVMIIHFSKLVTCLGILLILLVMLEYLLGGYVFFIFPFLKFFYANKQFLSISYLILHSLIFTIKGIGNSLAEWQPCHLILSGLYLYVLESALSQNYQRCSR